jgi:hypothetical protein
MTYQHAMQMIPSVAEIVEALRAAYDARGDERLRARAVDFAQGYDARRVYADYWRPLLVQLFQDLPHREL